MFLLFTTLILLYLDLRDSVLIISSVLLATNLGFAVLTILLTNSTREFTESMNTVSEVVYTGGET